MQGNGFNGMNEGLDWLINFLFPSNENLHNSPFDCIPQHINAPLLPQTEIAIIEPCNIVNATSISIPTNFLPDTNEHIWNSMFEDGFGNNEDSFPIPSEAYTEHNPFQEMHSCNLNVYKISSERRNRRSKLRRDCRSKERHPYQRHDKTSTDNKNNSKRLRTSEHPPQAKDEIKTQFSKEGLKFLLQKKLQQSDVGSLKRIVLPKRDAEANLPLLDVKEGMQILVQDWENNTTWDLKYRYWPNNNTRMYVLENTGNFVRTHGLQKGDYMMLYKDALDRFVIRGRKAIKLDLSSLYTISTEPKVEDGIGKEAEDGIGKILLKNSKEDSESLIFLETILETNSEMNSALVKQEEMNIMTFENEYLYKDAHYRFVIRGRKAIELELCSSDTITTEPEVGDGIVKTSLTNIRDDSESVNLLQTIREMSSEMNSVLGKQEEMNIMTYENQYLNDNYLWKVLSDTPF